MSFSLVEVRRLQYAGGAVWEKYRRLLIAADNAAADSPAARELAEFQRDWAADPQAAEEQARTEAAAAEAAARPLERELRGSLNDWPTFNPSK
jgi:hypothetical protein